MTFRNVLRQVRPILYRLKRNYGLPMYIRYTDTPDSFNYETGEIVRDLTEVYVRRGILLPVDIKRIFAYDLAYIAAGKNFTYGGFFDKATRMVIIDAKDLPTGFIITRNMYINFQSRRYEIKDTKQIPEDGVDGYGWLLQVHAVTSSADHVVTP